ncbi:hypothetical protein ACIQGW_22165 [Lysinibacillus xylanilyticus]|uniref:hypothetical protein n=1 Tax=Lysinibacillus xylanilyticus TaxID=582475 RepID=UPI00381172CB
MISVIRIGEAYKYLGGKEKYPTRESRKPLNDRIRRLITNGVIDGDRNEKVVDLISLTEQFEFEKKLIENYMDYICLLRKLGITNKPICATFKRTLEKLGDDSPFEYIDVSYRINNNTLFFSRLSVEKFLKDYISLNDAIKQVSKLENSNHLRWLCNKLQIEPFRIGVTTFYKRSDFEKIKNYKTTRKPSEYSDIAPKGYYYTKQFGEILSIDPKSTKIFKAIERDYDLNPVKLKGYRKCYEKEIVDNLKLRQDELREKYISYDEVKEIVNSEGFIFNTKYIETLPIDSLLRPFNRLKKSCYLRETFNSWLEERRKRDAFFSVAMESDFETFKFRLKIKEIDCDSMGTFTSETWFQFISRRLGNSRASRESIEASITRYIYCTEHLINLVSLTNKREIYSVTSNDINILFNEIQIKDARILYQYVKQIYNKLFTNEMTAFDFNRVNNPMNFYSDTEEKSVYEYEVYKKLYNYAKDIILHKERAINDIFEEIATGGEKRKIKYLSSCWLYVLLHLNNAWRNSDIIKFPRVNLKHTQIIDLNWMLENDLSDEDVNHIIGQVYRTEFIISKTQVKNYFFCSNELKKSFATAIAICELRTEVRNPLSKSIIDFGSKKNDFGNSRKRHFFELFEDKKFKFASRKMNRSLLSYIYVILSKTQKGTVALKTVQKMRGHLEKESTNFYIDIPEEELNFLTSQLFARGSFGFVYDTFLDVLQGVQIDREKRTKEIQLLENYFGDIYKIEEVSGFLNIIQSDRKTILDRIVSLGLDEALEFVNKIETEQLPSKKENVQCMVSESNCVKNGQGVDCLDCAYSIPNYYALSALGASLQKRMNSYLELQKTESEKSYYEQRKRARLFYIQLEMFAQAIKRFGFDVYEFLTDTREEFIEKQSYISSLNEQYQLEV